MGDAISKFFDRISSMLQGFTDLLYVDEAYLGHKELPQLHVSKRCIALKRDVLKS